MNRRAKVMVGIAALATALILAGGAVYATGLFGGSSTAATGQSAKAASVPDYASVFSGQSVARPAGPDVPASSSAQVTRTSPREVAAAAAQVIGIPERDLVKALTGGESLIALAADHGVSQQTLHDGLIAYESAALTKAVAAGQLSERQSELAARLFAADIDRFLAAAASKPNQ